MLFFFAGYEIDLGRIAGLPLRLALAGWAFSLVIAYTLGGILAALGVVVSLVYVGSALATTAIGTLIPVLSDTGELKTRVRALPARRRRGRGVRADPAADARALDPERVAQRADPGRVRRARRRSSPCWPSARPSARCRCSSGRSRRARSSRCAGSSCSCSRSRCSPSDLGLDLLLGGFAAGLITRQVARDARGAGVRLEADRGRLRRLRPVLLRRQRHAPRRRRAVLQLRPASAKLAIFFVLFLVVRGTPAMLLYRGVLPLREDRHGARAVHARRSCRSWWRSRPSRSTAGTCGPSTAAALVGAGALSTLAGPLHGLRMRRIARTRSGRPPRREPPPRPPRGPRRRPRPPPAHLAELGDVAPGAGDQRGRDRARRSCLPVIDEHARRARPADRALAPSQSIFSALAGGMITFTGIVFSAVFVAAQIQTSSYSPRLAARLRRDPVDHRRPRAPDRHGDLLARSRSPRSAARPTEPGRDFVPVATVAVRAAARARHARRVRRARPARVREHADRRHPAHADAPRLCRHRRGPPPRRRGRATSPRRRRRTPARRRSHTRARRP